eukprot:2062463-Amphidinium_carterae.1
MSKFYEHLQHGLLLTAARQFNFNPHLVLCAIQTYRGLRVMQFEGITSQPFRVHVASSAGCPRATALSALFMSSLHVLMFIQRVVDNLQ